MKKIVAVIFWILAAMSIVGSIANGSLVNAMKSGASAIGFLIGFTLPIAGFIVSGIFFFTFDNVYKLDYISGYKLRLKQNVYTIVFLVFFVVLVWFVGVAVGASGTENIILSLLISAWPYFVPVCAFAALVGCYVVGLSSCRKHCGYSDEMLSEYLSDPTAFTPICPNGSVLISDKALFFPKLFCLIPLKDIKSVKLVNLIVEQDVFFELNSGKKIEIVTRQFSYIDKAIKDYRAAEQKESVWVRLSDV